MDFAILVVKRNENFIVIYEGDYDSVVRAKESLSTDENAMVVRIDEATYNDKKQYLEILNEYIESCIASE